MSEKMKSVWEFVKIVIISLLIILPIRYFIIQPFYVKGASMEPNFHDHEYLIIDEISYRLNAPVRGEIVVFRYPKNPQEFFIKRVIGLPGESIEIKDGQVFIYNKQHPLGMMIDESSYLDNSVKTYNRWELGYDLSDAEKTQEAKITLGPDEYFVLGDNRGASSDSRFFGPVNKSFLKGKVWFRGWPVKEMGFSKEFQYNIDK